MKKILSFLYQANLFIRSLIFSILMALSIFFFSFSCLLILPLPFKTRYAMIAGFTGYLLFLLRIICRIDYRVQGLENISANQPGIILSKHQSTWETFYLPTIFPEVTIILKRELQWVPFFGWGILAIDPIAINRSKKSGAMEQIITQGKTCLDAGRWILVFPEGTRIPYGKVGHYKAGGARLAVETGYPIIPVAHNAGRFWPKRGFIKKPGTVQIIIGPLIETKNRAADEVLLQAKNWIEGTIRQIENEPD
ncbi:MAG TPA: lysophospholipid acyltransferase family protein [Gammaproteobacteria bacterium]|nr:lysophospholipid acyltransferase family protein [Gammaproteobacteria bacterium]